MVTVCRPASSAPYSHLRGGYSRTIPAARRLREPERRYIVQGGAQRAGAGEAATNPLTSLGYLPSKRKVWGLSLGFAAYGYSFSVLLTWLPGYLEMQLHRSVFK